MSVGRNRGATADHMEPQVPASSAPAAVLLVAFPRPAVLPVPQDGATVGRDWLAAQGLEDAEVSGAHLRFTRAGGVQLVQDVGSRNGTWIGGRPLTPTSNVALEDGMVVRIGRTLAVYREGLLGEQAPALPLGGLVAPFGLRRVARVVDALRHRAPPNILIEGETGTGKELAAEVVAAAVGRARPYAAVNVAGVAAGVFESQLFGHVAGAYSGAQNASKGIVQTHAGGTVFLDEIGELPLELQPKLLRLLENREVLPVGADKPIVVDVTIVAATNQSLEALVAQGRFRHDLLARLAVARLRMPPLRERAEDVFAIARTLAPALGLDFDHGVEVEAVERLLLDPWPSNVRGLAALMGQLAALDAKPGLRLWSVQEVLGKPSAAATAPLTAQVVAATLERTGGNESEAARKLGITRGKLRRFLKKQQ